MPVVGDGCSTSSTAVGPASAGGGTISSRAGSVDGVDRVDVGRADPLARLAPVRAFFFAAAGAAASVDAALRADGARLRAAEDGRALPEPRPGRPPVPIGMTTASSPSRRRASSGTAGPLPHGGRDRLAEVGERLGGG